jgi:hypothetical protein
MAESKNNGKGIYTIGAVTALFLLAYCLVTMVLVFTVGDQPLTAQEAFDMLRQNRLTGLLRLDMLTTLVMPLYYLLFVSLYVALKKSHENYAKITILLGCAGLTLFLAAPSFTSWLVLSDKFAAATSEAQKTLLLAAGEALLATDMWHSSSALVGGLLLQTSTLLISILMLRSNTFSKATAWMGVVAHGLDLLHILALPFIPMLGVILMITGGTLYLAWFPLLARDFFRLRKE